MNYKYIFYFLGIILIFISCETSAYLEEELPESVEEIAEYIDDGITPTVIVQCGHTDSVMSVAFNPEGTILASGGKDETIKIWDLKKDRLIVVLKGHTDEITSVIFSPDKDVLISASHDTINFWSTISWELVDTIEMYSYSVKSMALSPNGNYLATGGYDDTIMIRNIELNKLIHLLEGHHDNISALAFSPDGRYLASGSWDDSVKLWDVHSGKLLKNMEDHYDWVKGLVFSPDGKTLASTSNDETVKLWDVASGELIQTILWQTANINTAAYSPDGKWLLTGDSSGNIMCWKIQGQRADYNREILESGTIHDRPWSTLTEHAGSVFTLAFKPYKIFNGMEEPQIIFASGSGDCSVKFFEIESYYCHKSFNGHENNVCAIAFNPDDSLIAAGYTDSLIRIWDLESGAQVNVLDGHSNMVSDLEFSPDGALLASASYDDTAVLWDLKTGSHIHTLEGHTNGIIALDWSPDGTRLVTGSWDKTIKIWDANSGSIITTSEPTGDWILSVAWSPDGKTIAAGNNNEEITFWDINDNTDIDAYFVSMSDNCHYDDINSLCFNPAGNLLASGSEDKIIKIWNTMSWENVYTFYGHKDDILALDFSPDGTRLASSSYDNTVNIWDVISGELVHTIKNHAPVCLSGQTVAFSTDGTMLAACERNAIKIFNTNIWFCIANLVALENDDYIAYTDDGYILAPQNTAVVTYRKNESLYPYESVKPIYQKDSLGINQYIPLPPILSIDVISFSEPVLDTCETAELQITLLNTGPGDAIDVYSQVYCDYAGITFPEKSVFPVIKKEGGKFTISIPVNGDISLATGTANIDIYILEPHFKVRIKGKRIILPVRQYPQPDLVLAKFAVTEYQSAYPNKRIDINEIVETAFVIQNIGKGNAEDITVEVSNNQPGVILLGRVENNDLVKKESNISCLNSGNYNVIVYRYFINSDFKDQNINFSIKAMEKFGKYGFSEIKTVNINTELKEQGFIHTLKQDDEIPEEKVEIQTIPELKDRSDKLPYAETMESEFLPVVTVMDFMLENVSNQQGIVINEFLGTALFETCKFCIIHREQRMNMLKEIEFSLSDFSNEAHQLKAGEQLTAELIVVGSIVNMDGKYAITCKLLRVETGETVSAVSKIFSSITELINGCKQLAFDIADY